MGEKVVTGTGGLWFFRIFVTANRARDIPLSQFRVPKQVSDKAANTLHENAIGWFILGCVFVALFALFWYFKEYDVKNVIRWIRWSQMYLISFFVDDDYAVVWTSIKDGKPHSIEINYKMALDQVQRLTKYQLSDEVMGMIGLLAMKPLMAATEG